MADQVIKLNPQFDQLTIIEHEVRTTGAWHDVTGSDKLSHFFVAKNNSVNTAISKCWQITTTFDKLRAPIAGKKCLVCALYSEYEKEVEQSKVNTDEEIIMKEETGN